MTFLILYMFRHWNLFLKAYLDEVWNDLHHLQKPTKQNQPADGVSGNYIPCSIIVTDSFNVDTKSNCNSYFGEK